MTTLSHSDIERIVRERLAADPAFRQALLADPRAALTEATGLQVPGSVTVTVHEESLTDIHLVIPLAASDEVAEEDLKLVAGGGADPNSFGCYFEV